MDFLTRRESQTCHRTLLKPRFFHFRTHTPSSHSVRRESNDYDTSMSKSDEAFWAQLEEDQEDRERKQEKAERDAELAKSSPQIGMTKDEVEKCAWGTPDKKNIDTYSWGTTEQWVYRSKGYVYFKNGVVTSVSTSEQ